MDSMFLITLCFMSVLVAFCHGKKSQGVKNVDGTFFMSEQLRRKHHNIIIWNRDDDVITQWSGGAESHPNNKTNEIHACPWSYVMVSNKNRIPETHLEAQCMTHSCLNFGKNDLIKNETPFDHSRDVSFIPNSCCTKIEFGKWVKVRRVDPLSGFPRYSKRILLVAAACSCKHEVPRTS